MHSTLTHTHTHTRRKCNKNYVKIIPRFTMFSCQTGADAVHSKQIHPVYFYYIHSERLPLERRARRGGIALLDKNTTSMDYFNGCIGISRMGSARRRSARINIAVRILLVSACVYVCVFARSRAHVTIF